MTIYDSTKYRFATTTRDLYFRRQSTDEAIIKQIFVDQQYDLNRLGRAAELFEFVKRQVAKGLRPLVVDAGANIGVSPLFFMANLPSALVVAIEPELENFKLLSKNVEGLNIKAIHSAISSTAGRVRVIDPGLGHWAYRTELTARQDVPSDTVAGVTINDIYDSYRSTPFFPFIVKVDIEGAEADLFSCNTEWVERTPIIIVELHDWMLPKRGTSQPFLQCISKLDRDFVYINEDVYSIANDLQSLAARHDDGRRRD
jgi:FkbM family methyltransferase